MSEHLQSHQLFQNQPQEVIDRTLDGVEKYIMTKLYRVYVPAVLYKVINSVLFCHYRDMYVHCVGYSKFYDNNNYMTCTVYESRNSILRVHYNLEYMHIVLFLSVEHWTKFAALKGVTLICQNNSNENVPK